MKSPRTLNIAVIILLSLCRAITVKAQDRETMWVDSVYNSLSIEQRVGQLISMRGNWPNKEFDPNVSDYIQRYNIGGVCFFRHDAEAIVKQGNKWQEQAQTPLLFSIDAEWGLNMRVNGSLYYPFQTTLGAIDNRYDTLIYRMGQQVAEQCKRIGIHVNFAPDVDVNNNADNPVIGMRSFGEDPDNVSRKGAAYMLGMQSKGLITTAKHFPGHGNTTTDSHHGLPTVDSPYEDVQRIELTPFRWLIEKGINGIMVGHLYFPAIEPVKNTSSSLSYKVTTELLKEEMGFTGLIFTDGLEMQGVRKNISPDSVAYKAFMAGNDVLLLPVDVPTAINTISEACKNDNVAAARLEESCKKILRYKYRIGLTKTPSTPLKNLDDDLKKQEYQKLQKELYRKAITLIKNDDNTIPLDIDSTKKIACISIRKDEGNEIHTALKDRGLSTTSYSVTHSKVKSKTKELLDKLKDYDLVIVNIQGTNIYANKNYGINENTITFVNKLSQQNNIILTLFASPYALQGFNDNDNVRAIIVGYEDRTQVYDAVSDIISGDAEALGTSPLAVRMTSTSASLLDNRHTRRVDSIALDAIEKKIFPGCQIVALHHGEVIYDKNFGHFTYDNIHRVQSTDVYDLASLTKMLASTLAVMKLYDDGLLKLDNTLGDFFPYLKGSDKGDIKLIDIMTHQSGLRPWIPFYQGLIDDNGPKAEYFSKRQDDAHPTRVAQDLYLVSGFEHSIFDTIMTSQLKSKKYAYSDLGFYFIPKIVELLTNKSFPQYLYDNFYHPMHLESTCFNPLHSINKSRIAPTENDVVFRKQLLCGDVHDQAAALLGGISGHAGLFSNAHEVAVIMQMLLDKGNYKGQQLIKAKTIEYFTSAPFADNDNRRGIGFDKVPPDRKGSFTPTKKASLKSFGHTGFTGTFAWADPDNDLVVVFISNRVYPDANNNKLSKYNIRTLIHEAFYDAIK